MPSARESRATIAGTWLLAAVVPASALAIGSLLTEVLVVVAVAAAVACALLWLDPPRRVSRAARLVLVAMGIFLAATALQAVPLPASVVAAIAPTNADIWARALSPLHEAGPAWHPISVAPAATRVQLLRGVFYACVFLGAVRVAAREGGSAFLERLVVVSAALMAFSSLAHSAVSADRVFGIYRPRELYAYNVNRYGPLLNTNHLAAYLDIGAVVALGAVLSRRSMPRALAAGAALLCAGTAVWAASRGGLAGLFVGAGLTLGVALWTRRRLDSARAEAAILGACVVVAAVMIGLSMSDFARGDASSTDLSKLELAKSALALVPSSPWFGFGRGAFETVFPTIAYQPTYFTWTNPENLVAQWAAEWGVPVALAGAAALATAFRPRTILTAARPAIGAWAAIMATVLHDLVDFHLEVPGVVALVCVCAALVVAQRGSRRRRTEEEEAPPLRVVPWAVAAATALAVALVVPSLGHALREDRAALAELARSSSVAPEAFRADLRAATLRYPAEPYFPLIGAVRAQATGAPVMPWIARALERSPHFGRAHLVLARSLAPAHAAQARLEYRLAYVNDTLLRSTVLAEAPRLVTGSGDALELVPPGEDGIAVLDALAKALADRLPSTSAILDEELVRRSPNAEGALTRRARAALNDVEGDEPWCRDDAREACLNEGLAAADKLVALHPEECEPHVLVAALHIASGEPTKGLDGLRRAIERTTKRSACQRRLIQLSMKAGQRARADVELERLLRRGCASAADCADMYQWAASFEEGRGHARRAVVFYRRSFEASGAQDGALQSIGRVGERADMLADAISAYETLARRHPDEPKWKAREAELRDKLRAETMKLKAPREPDAGL